MLEVAAATLAGDRTQGDPPFSMGLLYLDHIRTNEFRAHFGDLDADRLPRQCPTNECHHLIDPRDHMAAVRNLSSHNVELITDSDRLPLMRQWEWITVRHVVRIGVERV